MCIRDRLYYNAQRSFESIVEDLSLAFVQSIFQGSSPNSNAPSTITQLKQSPAILLPPAVITSHVNTARGLLKGPSVPPSRLDEPKHASRVVLPSTTFVLQHFPAVLVAVSYTHLTLPTKRIV
eukprot:TRINITY_DN11506_c0_g1_i2.p1 TRINITY_DN11506_c0_g1~~TRINITY_DN11506_c0_g1_i2.p1  ORF type:complete len:132 (+),score=5.05 TRINITY_DN11506_c0_g1_i2:28-396(+)